MTTIFSLPQLGWSPFFQQQLSLEECTEFRPARIAAQHRSHFELYSEQGQQPLNLTTQMPLLTVGDWVLLNSDGSFYRRLDRLSLFSRKSAGSKVSEQYIAANIDTVFITTALNQNFSLNRIERYLALVKDAGAEAVIVLTKSDRCEDPQILVEQVQALDPLLVVEAVNAKDQLSVEALRLWCRSANTVAVLGSSGVGKSTLINTLSNQSSQKTAAARGDDDRGRHTTTSRSLHFMENGAVLLDTPGMRELQLSDCEDGVRSTFADINDLAEHCRYSDCQHESEPGCAVQQAIDAGVIDPRRLSNYSKLIREQAHNRASLAEKRAKDRSLGRFYRSVKNDVARRKKGQ
ncbi:ribosome small subunit-dependent GTPase A [Pseudoteredinibacter isoporae]|uniref:ribosome small subunit-dependent GTPase A n=1 Tax=Pseudoteredinibacter isoporae TaxID=570281 RepID=UPI0031089E5D